MMHTSPRRAFTLIEILTVVGILALLVAILLPALRTARRNAEWADAANNLRQVSTYLQAYITDNRESVAPTQFDYSTARNPGRVRGPSSSGVDPLLGPPRRGTWADILWTGANIDPPSLPTDDGQPPYAWEFDSPDRFYYGYDDAYSKNPMRSTVGIEKVQFPDSPDGSECRPFGPGISGQEIGHPGYFAGNLFFRQAQAPFYAGDATLNAPYQWWSAAQIRRPQSGMYLVDSKAGEVIGGTTRQEWEDQFDGDATDGRCQVDFRYLGDTCMFLLLDLHVDTQPAWTTLQELQGDWTGTSGSTNPIGRDIKVTNLERSDNPSPP
jgi:prepilin-type N-terminal cleavage/methylation domain-containing protein